MLPVLREGKEFEDLKSVLQNLDFGSNFNCRIVVLKDIAIGAFKFPHGLESTPSGKIVLKQIGGGYVLDSETPHDSKNMFLINTGATVISSLKLIVLR